MPVIDFSQIITAEEKQAAALAEYQRATTAAIDAHVEATARSRNYNSAAHCASYIASTVPIWAAEALAFVAWRDAVWLAAIAALQQAQQTGQIPDAAEVLDGLPVIVWPS
jgi:hypothetical protein